MSEDWRLDWRECLARPAIAGDVAALAALWQSVAIVVEAPRPPDFDAGPDFGLRLRGALGWALREMPAAPHPLWDTTAYEGLFGELPPGPAGMALSRPYALQALPAPGGRVALRLVLFGLARVWLAEVEAALAEALKRVNVRSGSPVQARLRPDVWQVEWQEGLEPFEPPSGKGWSEARVDLLSPLRVGNEQQATLDARGFLLALAARAEALAPWCELTLAGGDLRAAMVQAAERLVWHADLTTVTWTRRARAQAGRAVPMGGETGCVSLSGHLPPGTAALLALAETAGLGRNTTMGLGTLRPVLNSDNDPLEYQ